MTVLSEVQNGKILFNLLIYFSGQTHKFLTQFLDALGSLLLRQGIRLSRVFSTGSRHHIGEFLDAGFEFFNILADFRDIGLANGLSGAGAHVINRNPQRLQALSQVLGLSAQARQALFKFCRRANRGTDRTVHPGGNREETYRNCVKGIGHLRPADGGIHSTSNNDCTNYGNP
jgi:hypothetical protein